jgi:periplasmic protein TonB
MSKGTFFHAQTIAGPSQKSSEAVSQMRGLTGWPLPYSRLASFAAATSPDKTLRTKKNCQRAIRLIIYLPITNKNENDYHLQLFIMHHHPFHDALSLTSAIRGNKDCQHRLWSPITLMGVVFAHVGVVAIMAWTPSLTATQPVVAPLMVTLIGQTTVTQQQPLPPKKSMLPRSVRHRSRSISSIPNQISAAQQPRQIKPFLAASVSELIRLQTAPSNSTEGSVANALASLNDKPEADSPVTNQPDVTPLGRSQTPPRFDVDYLDNPAPVYPPLSKRSNEQGRVVLSVFVEPSGLASQIEIRSSSGFHRLDASAKAAVMKWRFIPARKGTEPIGAWVLVPIVFSLKESNT